MILDTRILGFDSDRFISLQQSNGRCATNKYFQIIGSIHDIESYYCIDNTFSLNVQIFFSHWGHLAIIFVWVSTDLFHIAWNANYPLFLKNPNARYTIAHSISDANFGFPISYAYSSPITRIALPLSPMPVDNTPSYSGIYNWLYTLGFNSVFHLYNFVMICELLAVISIALGKVHLIYNEELCNWLTFNKAFPELCSCSKELCSHYSKLKCKLHNNNLDINCNRIPQPLPLSSSSFVKKTSAYFSNGRLRLNFHTGIIIGFLSIAWCGHLVVVDGNSVATSLYITCDKNNHIFRSTYGAGQAILTFLGGLKSNTISLYLTDIAHHHLGLGILLVWGSHLYLSFYKGFGHRIGDVFVNGNSGPMIARSSVAYLTKSLQLQLSLGLAGLSYITSVLAQEMYSLTPYLYLTYDYIRTVALYLHHCWIASFLMIGTFAHNTIFLIRDCAILRLGGYNCVIRRISEHKGAIISHLT